MSNYIYMYFRNCGLTLTMCIVLLHAVVTCSIPSRPDNGQLYYVGRSYNDRVNFSCNPGYLLIGTSIRTCQSNGQWSGIQPSCSEYTLYIAYRASVHSMKIIVTFAPLFCDFAIGYTNMAENEGSNIYCMQISLT